jgi:hypothetical protein
MGRLRRFAEYRFIGRRDEMRFYDCDDPDQFDVLEDAVSKLKLDMINQLSSFAPDTSAEARNRGFGPVPSSRLEPSDE